MTPTKIRYLIAIIEKGSLVQAANFLNITQPPLSNLIKSLEEKYNTILFKREKNKLIPTPEVLLIAEKGKKILEILDDLEMDIVKQREKNTITLRIGINHSSSLFQIPDIIKKIKNENLPIMLDTYESSTDEILDKILKNEIDVGLCRSKVIHRNIITTEAHLEDLLVVIPNQNPLSKKKKIDVKDISNERIMLQKGINMPGINSTLKKIFYKSKIDPQIIYTGMNTLPMILMVSENMGVCFAPESFKNIKIENKPTFLPFSNIHASSPIYLIYKNDIKEETLNIFLRLSKGIFNQL